MGTYFSRVQALTDLAWSLREGSAESSLNAGGPTDTLALAMDHFLRSDQPPGAASLRRKLLAKVVFLVANHVPISDKPQFGFNRHAVAVLANQVAPRFEPIQDDTGGPAASAHDCGVLWMSASSSATPSAKGIERLWLQRWSEYGIVTDRGEQDGHYTWNQLLIRGVQRPKMIGVTWGSSSGQPSARSGHGSRVYVDVAPLIRSHSISDLWEMTADDVVGDWRSAAVPQALADSFISMKPSVPVTADSVCWSVFHLIRSFGGWSPESAAFVSIPIAFGSTSHGSSTCVLSICTTSPLTDVELLRWRFLANELFQPIVAKETEEIIRKAGIHYQFGEAAGNIGHSLKNRLAPLVSDLNAASNRVREGDLEAASRYLTWASQTAAATRKLGQLLHLLDQAAKYGMDKVDDKFLSTSPFDLGASIEKMAGELQPTSDRTLRKPRIGQSDLRQTLLFPFLRHSNGSFVRPCDAFYEEVFYELLMNGLNRGVPDTDRYVDVSVSRQGNAIVIGNSCDDRTFAALEHIPLKRWLKYPPRDGLAGRAGGLYYAALALSLTESGSLYVRRRLTDDGPRFEVRLLLKPLSQYTPEEY